MGIFRSGIGFPAGTNFFFLLAALSSATSLCRAQITYDVDLSIGAGSVTGDIITDGTTGVLSASNITGYNLLLSDPGVNVNTSTWDLSSVNFFPFNGSDLSATTSELLFDFSGTDSGEVNFEDPSLDYGVCFSTPGGASPSSLCAVEGETLTFLELPAGSMFPTGEDRETTTLRGTLAIGSATPEPGTYALSCIGIALVLSLMAVRRRVDFLRP